MEELREVGETVAQPADGKKIIVGNEAVSSEQFANLRENARGQYKLEKVEETAESVAYRKKDRMFG